MSDTLEQRLRELRRDLNRSDVTVFGLSVEYGDDLDAVLRRLSELEQAGHDFLNAYVDASVSDEEGLLSAVDQAQWSAAWQRVDETAQAFGAALARFVCPRGHRHYEGSVFCTVCGAGPVLSREGSG